MLDQDYRASAWFAGPEQVQIGNFAIPKNQERKQEQSLPSVKLTHQTNQTEKNGL